MARLLVMALLFSVSNVCWSQCVRGNCATGYGTYVISSSAKYVGAWKYGRFHGQGTYTYPDGRKYVGEFKDGERNGQGALTYPSGQKSVGEYKDGEMNGQGTHTWPDGQKYVGEFKDGKFHGQGTYTWPDVGNMSGEFKDDKFHGKGTYTGPDAITGRGSKTTKGMVRAPHMARRSEICRGVQRRQKEWSGHLNFARWSRICGSI